jgi:hypothetical protein
VVLTSESPREIVVLVLSGRLHMVSKILQYLINGLCNWF